MQGARGVRGQGAHVGSKIAKTWCVRGKTQKLNLVWKLQESKIHKEGFFNNWGNGFCIASLNFAKGKKNYLVYIYINSFFKASEFIRGLSQIAKLVK